MTFLKSSQDYDWRMAPQRDQSREKHHARAARIYIDNQHVDAVKLAVKKVESVPTVSAQPNAMTGPRPGFQNDPGAIRIRIHQQYDFLFQFPAFR
jgi:hypothetical protein